VKRILIVRMSALGDIVHALPVLASLRDAFPQVEIDWLVEASYAGLLDLVDGLSHRVVVRPGYRRAIRFMRSRKYDAALDLQGLIKSAVAARLSGARRVIGFERTALREPLASALYNGAARVPPGAHVVQKNLSVLPLVGADSGEVRFPFRTIPSRVADQVRATAPDGFVLINPGAAWPNKRWNPARFGALARQIRDRHSLMPVVLWGPEDDGLAGDVVATSDGRATRAPRTSLADVLALCRSARLMVSGDTGPLHLAAAMGTPLVGIYGPTWPDRNGPWDPADEVVSRAHACVCHHKRRCLRASMCIGDIGVDEVLAAVDRRLAKAVRA